MLLSLFTNELKMATVIILEVPTMLVFEIHTHTLEASAHTATDPHTLQLIRSAPKPAIND